MVMGSGFVQQPRHLIVTVLLIGTSPGHHVRRRIAPSEVMEDSPEGLDTDAKGGSDSEKPERVIAIKPAAKTRYSKEMLVNLN
jgi:hypothetical protein